jgi:peptidoglycan glycosyltransferase
MVTATAALRVDPNAAALTYECKPLPDGRVGNVVRGWGRPIRDDIADKSAHGAVNMQKGTVVSCNAYYAQLGTYKVGPDALHQTAEMFGISVANPNTPAKLKDALPQAAYGQGQVVASPFQLARVAATIANDGVMPFGRWIIDESNPRVEPDRTVVQPQLAQTLAQYMRGVVTNGTGRAAASAPVAVAGKTGTAELAKGASHAWFIGFAPFGSGNRRLAFAVLVENGQYGGSAAAPIAAEVMGAANQLGLFNAAAPEGAAR